jgi:hypothetical protein
MRRAARSPGAAGAASRAAQTALPGVPSSAGYQPDRLLMAWTSSCGGTLHPRRGDAPRLLAARTARFQHEATAWLAERSAELDAGNVPAIIGAARQYPLADIKAAELDKKLGYFERNAHRMRYADFRKLGMFTGSGAIEGGINAVVVQRAKKSGMHWTVDGAASIIALRCRQASGRWDELWPARATQTAGLRAAV